MKFAPLSANTAVLGGSFLALGLFWGPGGILAPNMAPLKIFTTLSEYCLLRPRGASRLDGLLIFENSFSYTFLIFAPLSGNTAFSGGSLFVLGLLVGPGAQLGPNLNSAWAQLGPTWPNLVQLGPNWFVPSPDCIHKCDLRVGPGPSSQGRQFRVVPSPDYIPRCDFRVGLGPSSQGRQFRVVPCLSA